MAMSAKELAAQLNVSPSAVSLALNGKPGISDSVRKLILEAAEKEGIRPRVSRQADAGGCVDVVCYKDHGQVFGESPFFAPVMENISVACSRDGYTTRILYCYKAEAERTIQTMNEDDSIGIILFATELREEDLNPFLKIGKPVIFLDAVYLTPGLYSVGINNVQGASLAAKYLLEMGHRRIGHLRSANYIMNFGERENGFRNILHNCPDCRMETVDVGSTEETAYTDMMAYLKTEPELPTAFFADNDIIAIACIRALKDMHFRVPQDVSMIGFDDIAVSAVSSPALTTVHVYKEDLGSTAVSLLQQRLRGELSTPSTVRLGAYLVERRSVIQLAQDEQ